jgi:hypothetical protein
LGDAFSVCFLRFETALDSAFSFAFSSADPSAYADGYLIPTAFPAIALVSFTILFLKRVMIKMGWGGKRILRFPLPHLTMKSEIPFAPFLIIAFLLTYLYQSDIFVITERLMSATGL